MLCVVGGLGAGVWWERRGAVFGGRGGVLCVVGGEGCCVWLEGRGAGVWWEGRGAVWWERRGVVCGGRGGVWWEECCVVGGCMYRGALLDSKHYSTGLIALHCCNSSSPSCLGRSTFCLCKRKDTQKQLVWQNVLEPCVVMNVHACCCTVVRLIRGGVHCG